MTSTEFLFNLVLLVISFAVPVATTFVIRYLETKLGNEKLKKYLSLAETAVKAAESTFLKPGSGTAKKAAVEKYLSDKIGNVLSAEDIDKLIQAAVFEINKAAGKIIVPDYPQVSPFINPTIGYPPPVTYTTTTSNTTVQNIQDKAAPDIPSPQPQSYADAVTQEEYKKAVDELKSETSGDDIDPTKY